MANVNTVTPSNGGASVTPPVVYGQVTIDGIQYIERPQTFVAEHVISVPNQLLTNQRLSLPGVADFLMKGLGRDFTIPNSPISHNRVFRFRIVNSEGTTWFWTGGLGIFDDRVFDSLCFGNAQFPFPLIPPVPVHASGNLVYEIEDIGLLPPGPPDYPYTLHLAFYGAYLIPVTGAGRGQGPLAFASGSQGTLQTNG
jgi:hypothetical protein